MSLHKLLFSICVCILVAEGFNRLSAQDINENNFTLYTKQEGLSQSYITDITQDSKGYLWIATGYGLNRFNGNNFVQFHSNKDSLSLPAEFVSRLVWLNS